MSTSPHPAAAAAPTTDVSPEAIAEAADRLVAAHFGGEACTPVRDLIGRDDVAAAYQIQERLNAAKVERGVRVVGRKIGATSEAVQTQLGVDQPDFGVLFDDMGFGDGEVIPSDRLIQPKAEAEVAFVLKADLAEGPLDDAQIRGAIDYAVAALEIVDSRIRDWDISFADTVADNASSGLYVLGTEHLTLDEVEPVDVTMTMSINGEEVSTGNGAACLGDPLKAVAWLAHQARTFGEPLRAGQVILSGALGPMRPLAPGDHVTATITGLGTVSTRFGTTTQEDNA
ncbi:MULTISPECIES: 2-keto-4-pentenoate hydratase [unclassified Nocardioides]|uniref:2-keto-4-pentenoate hydratase n=1 Tax=unclassified Nocardioides TaxID=2615069 RepID=UPI0006FEAEFF|nr:MULTISPECIES: fumarylacetoacetate hydrolase family protein [unclassified Nocardioides]KQY50104.1 2-keto-4-pentenoate hydratase [Nocardioides sp. Root140]KQZ75728.1 2-keto-4-pentenoate hydratase [Nocardioides sp. Root151]KRF14800.1 2-keto-4-pentenoate hydratase [Nocardioides sp. Soil796]